MAADEEAAELIAAAPNDSTLEDWVSRRERGEPLAWIVGTLTFCGQAVHVDSGVYVPRGQSEVLARRAAELLGDRDAYAADLCTGAGAIAVHLMKAAPMAEVIGVDMDMAAAVCARRNGVRVIVADLNQPLPLCPQRLDLVTAVAPYVPTGDLGFLPADVQRYEPRIALDGGDDGLDLVRRIVADAGRLLRPGGWLLLELGGNQDQALRGPLAASGFHLVDPWFDDDGDLRGLAAQLASGSRYRL